MDNNFWTLLLAVQKVLSGSGRAGRLRPMGKYIGHRLVARPELDNTFWTDSTSRRTFGDSRAERRQGEVQRTKPNLTLVNLDKLSS